MGSTKISLPASEQFGPGAQSFSAILTGLYGQPYKFGPCRSPLLRAHEALVRIDYSGVCHGDAYVRDGGGPAPKKPPRPLTGGHEGIGHIVSLGREEGEMADVNQEGFSIGDCVGIAWRCWTCGQCDACHSGADNHCPSQQVTGMHKAGTFQRYIAFPLDQLIRLPPSINLASACPILCAGVTSYVALKTMQPVAGKWVAISGAAGGVGHLAIQYAKKVFGLKVLAIDGGPGSEQKENLCQEMGCDGYVDFVKSGQGLVDEVQAKTGGGPEYVVVLSPHQSAYDAAGAYARFRAQIMAVGIGNCCFPLRPILQKDLIIRSTETGTKKDIEDALQFTAMGVVHSKIETLDLVDLNMALDRLKSGDVLGKLVLDLTRYGKSESGTGIANGTGTENETVHCLI